MQKCKQFSIYLINFTYGHFYFCVTQSVRKGKASSKKLDIDQENTYLNFSIFFSSQAN